MLDRGPNEDMFKVKKMSALCPKYGSLITMAELMVLNLYKEGMANVATAARAAATGPVSMSTRPDPKGSDTVEIATRRCPRLRVVWDLRELTH